MSPPCATCEDSPQGQTLYPRCICMERCIPFGACACASRQLSWQHLLGCLSWAGRRLLMGWRHQKSCLGWYMTAIPLLHRVVCVVEKDVAPPDPCSGARLERVTYRIHNLNASVRVKNSVTSPALEGRPLLNER